ncbi:MAG: hypothetical protein JJU33_09450 [Phycisphaerales bacterium]|nr:hypothetical protein [Phycisphaerales bacterium]
MTSDAILNLLFAAADDVGRTFDHRDLAEWPAGSHRVFLKLGILRQSAGGLMASCPSCDDGHVELVSQRPGPDGEPRLYIYCPEQLRLEVSAEMCRGWEVDLDGLATLLNSAMELKGKPKPLIPNRLWRLGRIPWEGNTREVMLATRLGDPDGASVAAPVGVGGRAIVLVPRQVPDDRVWPGRVPAVVALERVAELDDDRFVIDGVALMEAVAEADAVALERGEIPQEQLAAKKVRQQVDKAIKSMLSNEALVQEYRIRGSYRKAADALVAAGYRTNRYAVERAVKTAGGPDAVKQGADSNSVIRTVASQPRDRSKNFSQRR